MKNKKGFTLIELIITVVILLSILAIAIISVSNLSKKQKENSYEKVKEEAITAATDFYYSNEYLFEELGDNGSAYVTIGYLVENGYLNLLTNPKTGEKLPYCTRVNISKADGVVHLDYDESPANDDKIVCSNANNFTYTNVELEKATVNLETKLVLSDPSYNKSKNNDWYNKNVDVSVNALTNVNTNKVYDSNQHKIYYCESDGNTICSPNNEITNLFSISGNAKNYTDNNVFSSSTTGKMVCYLSKYKNEENIEEQITNCHYAKIDKEPPTLNITTYLSSSDKDDVSSYLDSKIPSNYNGNWYSGYIGINAQAQDDIGNVQINYKRTKGIIGGSSLKNINTLIDKKTQSIYDYSVAEGISNYNYEACDEAGNCTSMNKIVKLDRTKPEIVYDIDDKYKKIYSTNNSTLSWQNTAGKTATFDVQMTDDISGIDTKKYEDKDGTKGFVEIKWNESGSTEFGDDSKLVKSEVLFTNSFDKIEPITNGYKRIGGSLQAEGARHETYSVCDKAGNCDTKHIYAKIDNTAPYTPWFKDEVLSKAYYRGLKCVKTDVDISNVNIAAKDSYIPNFSAGSKSNYFNSAGSYSESNFINQNKNIYCTVKKMGDGTNPLSFVDKYSSIVESQIIWRHNADSNPWQSSRNNEYTTWTKYKDFDVSYISNNSYQEATYAIYILRIKDEAGNYSNAFRLDISPCYSQQSNKCGKGDSNDGTLYSGMW